MNQGKYVFAQIVKFFPNEYLTSLSGNIMVTIMSSISLVGTKLKIDRLTHGIL